ncbi:MAG TPA: response regulator [Gemmatimonadaceae bacterium]
MTTGSHVDVTAVEAGVCIYRPLEWHSCTPHNSRKKRDLSDPATGIQPEHLLIIEDEDNIREVASLSLEVTEGWQISTASSGALGVALALREKPDAILLDVMMPDKDGPAIFRELQSSEETNAIPVIFLTAKVQGPERQRFMELGVRGVIAKPFDPLTLGKQIRDALGWRTSTEAVAESTSQPPSTLEPHRR